jgi:hypothetical protein
MLLPSHRTAGEAVRALDWIGERRTAEALSLFKQKLSPSAVDELIALRSALPVWMCKSIGRTFVPLAPIVLPAHSYGLAMTRSGIE